MREKIIRFMNGRYGMYGVDTFSFALFILYFIVSFGVGFVPNVWVRLGARVLALSIAAFMFYRLFSKNIYQRRKENAAVRKILGKTKSFFKLQFDRIKNIKRYRYRRCPHCKAVLQLPLPSKSGKNTVVCPKCRERFSVFNLF